MSDELNRTILTQNTLVPPRRSYGIHGCHITRLITLVSASMALGMVACTDGAPTEPSVGTDSKAARVKTYTAIDLGTLPGGRSSIGYDINPAGQVVGGSDTDGERHAFLWYKGVMTDLGTLGGTNSTAFGINPRGQVVGASTTASGVSHAFLWNKGTMIDLGTLGGEFSSAEAINPRGQVVGVSTTASGGSHGFLWENGIMTDLGPLTATGVNPAGRIVGNSQPPGRAALWVKGVITDLGTLGGPTFAGDINPSGAVVGTSNGRAFLWEKGVMTDLGTLGEEFLLSFATGISPSGVVVGSSETAGERLIRAFIWEAGVMTALEPLDGGSYSRAEDINPARQVVGESSAGSNEVHATLWTPK
jgi:probable HAF family extracellular repeat protein